MFGIENFIVFLTTGILLNLYPGPDSMYIIARSISQGRRAGIFDQFGVIVSYSYWFGWIICHHSLFSPCLSNTQVCWSVLFIISSDPHDKRVKQDYSVILVSNWLPLNLKVNNPKTDSSFNL